MIRRGRRLRRPSEPNLDHRPSTVRMALRWLDTKSRTEVARTNGIALVKGRRANSGPSAHGPPLFDPIHWTRLTGTDHRHQKPSCPLLMFRPRFANGFGRSINPNRANFQLERWTTGWGQANCSKRKLHDVSYRAGLRHSGASQS
jgi:hypothetical protein